MHLQEVLIENLKEYLTCGNGNCIPPKNAPRGRVHPKQPHCKSTYFKYAFIYQFIPRLYSQETVCAPALHWALCQELGLFQQTRQTRSRPSKVAPRCDQILDIRINAQHLRCVKISQKFMTLLHYNYLSHSHSQQIFSEHLSQIY